MKRFLLPFLFLLLPMFVNSQTINKLGKIHINELPKAADHEIMKVDGMYKVFADSLNFDGNTYYKIPNGYITSLEVFDKEKDYIKQYDSNGKLLVTIFSDRIINLKISCNGNRIAYFDNKNIILIDLVNYTSDTLKGSFAYSFLSDNSFVYYNSENHTIQYKGDNIFIDSYPNEFLEYKNRLLVLSKAYVIELSGVNLIALYELEGELFDAKIIDNEFYFVDKIEKRKKVGYTLYKTTDFKKFIIIDKFDDLNR